jgi:hypothetical protein
VKQTLNIMKPPITINALDMKARTIMVAVIGDIKAKTPPTKVSKDPSPFGSDLSVICSLINGQA